MKKAKVFEQTYTGYLRQLSSIDISSRAARLGCQRQKDGELIVPFYGKKFLVNETGIVAEDGTEATFAVCVVLCKYVLMCPEEDIAAPEDFVSFRDFKDSGPLHSYFATNTNRLIEQSYGGSLALLGKACLALGGSMLSEENYDLSCRFNVLPKIEVVLKFNDRDEMFSAQASILFRQSAELYLDMECIAIAGTFLAGNLLTWRKQQEGNIAIP